jgi:hypothetical protein
MRSLLADAGEDKGDVVFADTWPCPIPRAPVRAGIMGTEAMFCRQAGVLHGIPVPELLCEGPGFLVDSEVTGAPWAKAAGHLSTRERAILLRELGQIAARLHALPCLQGQFGCPAPEAGLLAAYWPTAFTAMVEAILQDAARWDSPIGISPAEVRELLADGAEALSEVHKASLAQARQPLRHRIPASQRHRTARDRDHRPRAGVLGRSGR